MRLALRHSGATKSATKMHLRHGGVTKEVERAWIRTGGKTVQFFSAIDSGGANPALTASPADGVGGAGASSSTITVFTRAVTVSVAGGVPPYSYAWTHLSGDPMTAVFPSNPSTSFSASVAPGAFLDAIFRCTVTDAAGSTGTIDVEATLSNRGGTL